MANYPDKAVKKFTKPAHREIAVGILIAYGLFPRTNDGIAQAEKLIASRETWLAPSDLPSYYADIESDLMTGNETAGIVNIRMRLKEFYGLSDTKAPQNKLKVNTGQTTVYKPEDKFVDDKVEELDKKLEETSNQIMDAVDALIEQQKQAFEEFKRQEAEKVQQRIAGRNQYPEPIGPLPMQGPKEPPKKTVAPEKDEDWESEVPDQLGTKLDELIEQVKNDPLPQASTKRRKTKGKTPVKRRKLLGESAGLSTTLSEIYQNIVDTKETLFKLYKVESERFELRKKTDNALTQLLKSKRREASLEGISSDGSGDGKGGDGNSQDDQDTKDSTVDKAISAGLISAITAFLMPLTLDAMRPFFQKETEDLDTQFDEDVVVNSEETDQQIEETAKDLQEPEPKPQPASDASTPEAQPAPAAPAPEQTPTQPQNAPPPPTDASPPNSGYAPQMGIPLRAAAAGGKFAGGKQEKLSPLSKSDAKPPQELKKLTKPLSAAVTLPQKAITLGGLALAKTVINPFSAVLPDFALDFVKNAFNDIARSAGLPGFDLGIASGSNVFENLIKLIKKIFEPLFNLFKGVGGGRGNAGPGSGDSNPPPGPDNTPNNFKGSTGQEQAMNFFQGKGLSAEQSAGIVGNLMQESTAAIDPKASNKTGHRGIAQWDASRWAGFEKFAKDKGLDVNTREAQLQWVWEEMRTGSGGLGINRFKSSAKTAEQAAALFLTDYERSGEKPGMHGYDVRLENAKALAKKYKIKPPPQPTPPEKTPKDEETQEEATRRVVTSRGSRNRPVKPPSATAPVGTPTQKQPGG